MATITIELPSAMEETLRERARRDGRTLEDYVVDLVHQAALASNGMAVNAIAAQASLAEFERVLDELPVGLAPLPKLQADLSRADFHDEHD
jgi:plasmid stability protein